MNVSTMLAVFLHPPGRDIRVESTPIPQIEQPDDAIVKVTLSGLCGSDLHAYRGLEIFNSPYIMGHEFVGIVVALGSSYMNEDGKGRPALYSSLAIGDRVISPFTVSCAECLFCRSGFTSRCVESKLFGSPAQPGAQAQYVRVPKAGGTLLRVPDIASQNASVPDGLLLPLCDVLPTGYFAAQQALRHPNLQSVLSSSWLNMTASLLDAERTLAIAVVGLGPIGICALISLLDELSPLSITWVIVAIDPNSDRRQKASNMLSKWNTDVTDHVLLVSPSEAKEAFELRGFPDGCHAALEAVGNNDALRLSYSLIRPFGVISSVGVYTNPIFPLSGDELFAKNVSLSFGRCPAKAIFPHALEVLRRRMKVFGDIGDGSGFIDRVVQIKEEDVKAAYVDFEEGKVGKTLIDPWAFSV